ncbi:hypothetical protein PAT3040_02085 [Paenibacillus agaridevorans]|uniref:ABC transporter substrate-binding protein n=1 Tax=Paenibacillus agaridevorans TaxID=171404 RepID=A0A2R5ELL9_9BACL|nr:extracellular solute-binding protein [Paenibacillus agaridevorans]GBG07532.1 hypothetical protein PAT3040_02085 [Paenibacillus agaridevorans]
MSNRELNVALIDGPAYRPLYQSLESFASNTGIRVNIAFTGSHPELNRHLKDVVRTRECPYDLISTHTKYAPSQSDYLLCLDGQFQAEELEDFPQALLELARVDGELKSIPRNFDARLLLYRTDWLEQLGVQVPETWESLYEAAAAAKRRGWTGFAYPGTFFELLTSYGGTLFDEKLRPAFESAAGTKALRFLKRLYQEGLTPSELPDMHYDEVSRSFRVGSTMMITDWPGYDSFLREGGCVVNERYGYALTPGNEDGKRAVYCGSHSFAVTTFSRQPELAIRLLKFLISAESQRIDAEHGHVPVRRSLLEEQKKSSMAGTLAAKRLELLHETMRTSVIIPPKFAKYPETEDLLWKALQACIVGSLTEEEALREAAGNIVAAMERG